MFRSIFHKFRKLKVINFQIFRPFGAKINIVIFNMFFVRFDVQKNSIEIWSILFQDENVCLLFSCIQHSGIKIKYFHNGVATINICCMLKM